MGACARQSILAVTLSVAIAVTASAKAHADEDPFVTTWRTTTAGEPITISTYTAFGAHTIDWGDGTEPTTAWLDQTHVYEELGTYTVSITDDFTQIRFYDDQDDAKRLVSIDSWGDVRWASMDHAFGAASNMGYDTADAPDFSALADLQYMFYLAALFNENISGWDASSVTNMRDMFNDADPFNQDISSWDASSVTDMGNMLAGAGAFDQNLGSWYVVLDDAVINHDDAPGTVERITAQNSFLDGQNPVCGIGTGGDSGPFELDGTSLVLKAAPTKGAYAVTVTSTGGFGSNNSKTFDVPVTNFNSPPLADAGPDQTVAEGAAVALDGTASDADPGNSLAYTWTHNSTLLITKSPGTVGPATGR